MSSLNISLFLTVTLTALACRPSLPPPIDCHKPTLSERDIVKLVEKEIRRQGGKPDRNRRVRRQIKRDGCDYLYQEIFLPERPGGYLIARLNEAGEVVELFGGH